METQTLYRKLASHYLHAIEAGTLTPGARMPSVRVLMARHAVSLSTALQLCRYLESQGVLEARPRSGYFVLPKRAPALALANEPASTLPDPARYVGVNQKVSSFLELGQQAKISVNLCGAWAAPELYPNEALRVAINRTLRERPLLLGEPAPHNGDLHFRSVLARNALASGMTLSADAIIVTHGCIEALNLALRATTQPGDVVAVESPTFFGLLQILESLGLQALEIPTSPHTGISLDALDLAAQAYPNIKAVVVVPNLQNPLGSVMPDANKERLVAWCEAQQIALIEDDTYAALSDAEAPLTALKAWDRTGNVIHCASLHKTLSPGLRLGWLSPGRWQARVEMLKYAQSRPSPALPQVAVADFLASPAYGRHLRRLRGQLREQRRLVATAVARHFPAGTRLSLPNGGLALWVEMPGNRSSSALFHAALRQGIRLAPGAQFSNSGRFEHFVRISCGAPYTAELDQALQTVGQLVRDLPSS
ncbi:aminotransferase-like domain-containing protein [Chitinimonas naiadis]